MCFRVGEKVTATAKKVFGLLQPNKVGPHFFQVDAVLEKAFHFAAPCLMFDEVIIGDGDRFVKLIVSF